MSATMLTHPSAEREAQQVEAKLSVLIAEDNLDGAETLARVLERAGHEVRVVYDGKAAVAVALTDPPDVALLDIGLPGLDGWEAARRIRKGLHGRPCLLVAITAYDQPADRERSYQAGFDLHAAKPIDLGALLALLERQRPTAA
jgi:two-component system OmpR family response regulator